MAAGPEGFEWSSARWLAGIRPVPTEMNDKVLRELSQILGLFHERAVQAVFTPWDSVTDAFNTYYGGTHFLVPAAILAWLVLRHPERYARARTALAVLATLPERPAQAQQEFDV